MLGFNLIVFEVLINIGVSVSNFWLVILQRERPVKKQVKRLWWRFLGKIKDDFTFKNFTIQSHYPRRIKYLQNFFIISLITTNLFVHEGKTYFRTLAQNMVEDWNYKNLYSLQPEKTINKTNSTITPVITSLPYSTLQRLEH